MSMVYLAGGMRVEWRRRVRAALPGVLWLDPTEHGLADVASYTAWDLQSVRDCDVVFAYLEASNPVGYNMAFEVGYAVALGKPVIFVDEKHAGNARPCSMLRQMARHAPETLEDGIQLLKDFVTTGQPGAA
jgi:nucleoside 2-deoxyribosyltransferase